MMSIRRAEEVDIPVILEVINDAAKSYKGLIPDDTYKEPYMLLAELR
jgi:N-acetylglutamate synthase-like GNAT family acetyltransferase